MRKLFALVALAVLACTPGKEAGLAAPPNGRVTFNAAFGDTLDYSFLVSSFGARATGLLFSVRPQGTFTSGWTVPTRRPSSTLSTQFYLINPTAWDSASFALWAWGTRGSAVSPDSTLVAVWKRVRAPGAPPGGTLDSTRTIGSIILTPPAVTLAFLGQQQFCSFMKFVDGRVAMKSVQAAVCASVYQGAFSSTQRAVSPAQQAKTDSTCTAYRLQANDLGSITQENCTPAGPASFHLPYRHPEVYIARALPPRNIWEGAYGR